MKDRKYSKHANLRRIIAVTLCFVLLFSASICFTACDAPQGEPGIQGEKGDKGDQGEPANSNLISCGNLNEVNPFQNRRSSFDF